MNNVAPSSGQTKMLGRTLGVSAEEVEVIIETQIVRVAAVDEARGEEACLVRVQPGRE